MNTQQLKDEILGMLKSVWDDQQKLQRIRDFLIEEIYEEQDAVDKIPEQYQEVVKEIAGYVDCGLTCFLNPDTLELEYATEEELMAMDDPEEYESITGESFDGTLNFESWEKCITVEKPESHESFGIMESFTNQLTDNFLQNKLVNALNNRKPFANFNHIIHNSKFKEEWFAFKQQCLETWVWRSIEHEVASDS